MKKLSLSGSWQAVCIDDKGREEFSFEGVVPGCVHTDLAGSKLPEDIFYRNNADKAQWIENKDWKYTKRFTLETLPEKAALVFEGLDTYTEITLNGKTVAFTDNMFITHRFEIADKLISGENELTVYFRSPIRMVEGLEPREGAFTTERMHTRRIQCTYGWDWVARFVTCGIWREVFLDFSDSFDVKHLYVYTDNIVGSTAQIVVSAELENYEEGGMLELSLLDPDGNTVYKNTWFKKENSLKAYITVKNARLWYPTGYGEQPLYTLKTGSKTVKFGIRKVSVLEEPDEDGSDYYNTCLRIKDTVSGEIYDKNTEFSGFLLTVNGLPIMCKGANWVPSSPFPSAEEDEKITRILGLGVEAGLNMLRVWGGGIFERQHFYNECDRLGILVTQDFLMACGSYPDEKPEFISQLLLETEEAAYALRNHPCLVWWSGDNENAVRGADDMETYKGRAAIHEGIIPVLDRLDPQRRFMLSSPCGGKFYASKTVGTTHNTQYLGESVFPFILDTDMSDYKEHFSQYLARFIAEEPTAGAISTPSLRQFMAEDDILGSTEMWEYHTKGNPALSTTLFEIFSSFARKVLGDYKDCADRLFKLKYAQFEWVRITFENFRRNRGFSNGMIYWMWDDCWPAAAGWSFVDWYGLPKASYYSFKRCAGELLTSIEKKTDFEISVCNDSLTDLQVTLSLSYLLEGELYRITDTVVTAKAASSFVALCLPEDVLPEGAVLICDALSGERQDRSFYKAGKLLIRPTDALRVTARKEDSVTLIADGYVHAAELEGSFVFSDNYFSLLPGESRTITFRNAEVGFDADITVSGYTVE